VKNLKIYDKYIRDFSPAGFGLAVEMHQQPRIYSSTFVLDTCVWVANFSSSNVISSSELFDQASEAFSAWFVCVCLYINCPR
jgi:hypothetical protein